VTEGRSPRSVASVRRRAATRAALLVALLVVAIAPSSVDAVEAPGRSAARSYIITLDVPDAGRVIDVAMRGGGSRIRERAQRTRAATRQVERTHDITATHRFTHVFAGFAARLTTREAAELARDGAVLSVKPAARIGIASQTVPDGIRRTRAIPHAGPSVDADIAILDTGIGPVGGNELDVRGGVDCSDDGRGLIRDVNGHGTHVAGTAAARDNGIGAVGVAAGARLWSVRVLDRFGYGDDATVVCGLDWVAATRGPNPPPGSQPIEVVNMSISASRSPKDVESCQGRPARDPDPIHLAVCSVFEAGVTIVVAAGNYGADAERFRPAGYDQVITVGAISDFDGRPGGKAATSCGQTFLGRPADDRYAPYSNHGPDVDILAPGTCVVSTEPSANGDATRVLTGTSMSAPHVAGAVARYLAANPGVEPERVRRVLRAAGRLDWEVATDPGWDGPRDRSGPHRLLDVAALSGPPGLRAWVVPRRFVAGRDTTRQSGRVDIQRLGGYDADVALQLDGLPGSVGDATFAPATLGLGELGARLTLRFDRDAPDGRHVLRIDAPGAPPVAKGALRLRLDRSGPVIDGMRVAIQGGRRGLPRGRSASVRVTWSVADVLGDVGRTVLQKRVGRGAWRDVAAGRALETATTTIRAGTPTAFRVTARDDLGNASRSRVRAVRLAMRDSSSRAWLRPAATWQTATSDSAIGQSLLTTRSRGSLSIDLEGDAYALVAPMGPGRGSFRVRVDDGPWRLVDLRAPISRARRVVHRATLTAGPHRLEIRAASGVAAIDALLLVR
jgi:hypothetical protein